MEKGKKKQNFLYTSWIQLDQTIMIVSVHHHHHYGRGGCACPNRRRLSYLFFFLVHKHFFQSLPQLLHSTHKTTLRSHISSVKVISPRIGRRIPISTIIVHVL